MINFKHSKFFSNFKNEINSDVSLKCKKSENRQYFIDVVRYFNVESFINFDTFRVDLKSSNFKKLKICILIYGNEARILIKHNKGFLFFS